MKIQYLTWLHEKTGKFEDTIDLPKNVKSIESLMQYLEENKPECASVFRNRHVIHTAVNNEIQSSEFSIKNSDKISFFRQLLGDKMLKGLQSIRYEKHIDLPLFGEKKQKQLLDCEVAIIGAGGLGCPTALYLCASGLGKIKLIDNDEISLSNLARQILYSYNELGSNKVDIAKQKLNYINPDCLIEPICARLNENNAFEYLQTCDLIIDASDNFHTRYLLNKIAIDFKKPLLSGSVVHYTGQVILFHPTNDDNSPCYNCLYPVQPGHHEIPACVDSGVLSPVTGTIGSIMATEAIKYLTDIQKQNYNEMLIYGALGGQFDRIKIQKYNNCKICNI